MTDCIAPESLPFHPQLPVVVQSDAPEISSDGGALLLREIDDQLGLTAALAACLPDEREPTRVLHSRLEQTRQRIYQIALGYEDDQQLGGIDYLLGLAKNSALLRLLEPEMDLARELSDRKGEKIVRYSSFSYAAKSWPRRRHVVAKAEHSLKGRYAIDSRSKRQLS